MSMQSENARSQLGIKDRADRDSRTAQADWFSDLLPRKRFDGTRSKPENVEQDYTKQALHGMGRFGRVHSWQRKSDRRQVAIRQVRIAVNCNREEQVTREERLDRGSRGVNALVKLSQTHANLVIIHDVFFTNEPINGLHLHLVMEYCNLGNLSRYMQVKDHRVEENIADKMHQCACALEFLHKRSVIHGSIKLSSILISEENGRHIVKLGDFRLFKFFLCDQQDKNDRDALTYRALLQNFQHTSPFHNATLPFAAPEIFAALEGEELIDGCFYLTPATDVFAMGVAFAFMVAYTSDSDYVMLLRQRVGESVGEEMWLSSRDGDPLPEVVDHADDDSMLRRDMKQLVLDMTQYSECNRLTASGVLRQIKKLTDAHARQISRDIKRLAGGDAVNVVPETPYHEEVTDHEESADQEDEVTGSEEAAASREEVKNAQEESKTGQGEAMTGQEDTRVSQAMTGQEKARIGQEEAGMGQEEARIDQEQARSYQEEARIGQEEAKSGQEEARSGQEEVGLGHAQVDGAPPGDLDDAALLAGPDGPCVYDQSHSSNRESEKRSCITYGTSVYAVPSERVTDNMDFEAYLAENRATPRWSIGFLTQDVRTGCLYLLTTAHGILCVDWTQESEFNEVQQEYGVRRAMWKEFTDMSFFLRFCYNGENKSVRVSGKAFAYLGDFTKAGIGQYSGQCQPSVYVDVLAIEVDDVAVLQQPYCDFSRIGGVEIGKLDAADMDEPCDWLYKQSRNFTDVQRGRHVVVTEDRFYSQDLPGTSQTNTLRVSGMQNWRGCSGSAIFSRRIVNGRAVIALRGFTFKHVEGPHNLMAVYISPCLLALESHFDLHLRLYCRASVCTRVSPPASPLVGSRDIEANDNED